jgi:hypothetical protein
MAPIMRAESAAAAAVVDRCNARSWEPSLTPKGKEGRTTGGRAGGQYTGAPGPRTLLRAGGEEEETQWRRVPPDSLEQHV